MSNTRTYHAIKKRNERLRFNKKAISIPQQQVLVVIQPPPQIVEPRPIPPIVDKAIGLANRNKRPEITERRQIDFDRELKYLNQKCTLTRKVEALQAKGLITEFETSKSPGYVPLRKAKIGFMDNIGEVFECSYDIPARAKRNI